MNQYASQNPNVELDLQRGEGADAGLTRQRRRAASRRPEMTGIPRLRHAVLEVRRALMPSGAVIGLAALLLGASQLAFALPTGEQVAAGTASVSRPNAQTLQVNQASQKAILNWNSFSIGASEAVNFLQPGASAVALNRVLGNNPSEIFGHLTANGQIFLVNPSGVLFGRGASVDVGGIAATTLGISNSDFLAGNYVFTNGGSAGSVVNQGTISVPSGYAALIGPSVTNEGLIAARLGSVALAAGDRVAVDMIGDGLISVRVDQAALNAAAINKGTIQADGGNVILTARSANALLDTVINNEGTIRAQSLVEKNGSIFLDGGNAGVVSVSGALDASGTQAGARGGVVNLSGEYVANAGTIRADGSSGAAAGQITIDSTNATLLTSNSVTAANGTGENSNGGNILIASAGKTIVRPDATLEAKGGTTGDGGYIKIGTGNDTVFFETTKVDASAPGGKAGVLHIDPLDLTITDAAALGGDQDLILPAISFATADTALNTVSRGSLEAVINTVNIVLEAKNTITVNNMAGDLINLLSTVGSITLRTRNNSGLGGGETSTGGITFLDTADELRTAGGAITIEAGYSAAGTVVGTATSDASLGKLTSTNGAITVSASRNVTLNNAVNAGAGTVVNLNFGQAGAGGTLTIPAAATITTGTNTASVAGHAVGTDVINFTRDADMTLNNTTLTNNTTGQVFNLTNIDSVILTGGAGANIINASLFTGPVTITGAGGADVLIGGNGA
ncbi:MAG: filamentous hemagglutinin N-terminal domain-containing protein, partial [Pseudomonadota bacterium]